jgi:phytol kinase
MQHILEAFIATIFFGIYLIGSEYVYRSFASQRFVTRKLTHIVSILFTIWMSFLLPSNLFLLLLLAYFIVICVSFNFKIFSFIHRVDRKTYGEIVLPLGLLAAFLIAAGDQRIFVASALVLGFSDAAANLVGYIRKSHGKTVYGSLAFFVTAEIILMLIYGFFPQIAGIALVAAVCEYVSTYGLDNVTIPLSVSILLRLLIR